MSRIAVIGWGSLLWDLDDLAPKVEGPWQMGAGPRLPMEFTRVSPKRKMGLVVCLCPEVGVPCATHVIRSLRREIGEAIEDLTLRERTGQDQIGGLCRLSGHRQGRGAIADTVGRWCEEAGWDGAVWTDLLPNYREHRGESFTLDGALAYLQTLAGESLEEAVRYISYAPPHTSTPLRTYLRQHAWWQSQVAIHAPDSLDRDHIEG